MPRLCLVWHSWTDYDWRMTTLQKNQQVTDYADTSGAPIMSTSDYARLRQYPLREELADELDRAIVVPMEQLPADVVTMHSRLTYADQQTQILREIELVYPDEADPAQAKISVMTPVGSAMIGLRVGQEMTWDFPDGTSHRLRVVSVKQPR